MIPYTVVKAQKPKEKAPLRNEEVSISFHKPFKLVKTQIQQPSVKKSMVPSVVHIIERKSKKKGTVTRIDLNDKPVHVIQPRKGKKGCRFTHQDLYGDQNLKKDEEKPEQKKEIKVQQVKQKQIDKSEVNIVFVNDVKQERTERRIREEEEDVMMVESEEELIKKGKMIKSHRNLSRINKKNEEQSEQEIILSYAPVEQAYLSREGRKSLQRNLELSNQLPLPKEQQIILPEESSSYQEKGKDIKLKRAILSMKSDHEQKPFYQQIFIPEQFERKEAKTSAVLKRQILAGKPEQSIVGVYKASETLEIYPIEQAYLSREGRKSLQRNLELSNQLPLPKEQQIILPEESSSYQEKGKDIKLKRAILSMKSDHEQKPFYQQIFIPEQFERKEAKTSAVLKRQILAGKPEQSIVGVYKASETLEIYPIEQAYLSREGRKSLQRNLELSNQLPLPKEQQIILPEESSSYQEKGKDIKLKRAILSMKSDHEQKPFYQQIFIPEQFERKEAKTSAVLKRQLQPDSSQPLNSQNFPLHQPKDHSQVPTLPSSSIDAPLPLQQSKESFPAPNHPSKLKRSLNSSLPLPSIPQMNHLNSSLSLSQTMTKLFNVYNPSSYFSSDKESSAKDKTLGINSSSRSLKPHRRPGMYK